MDRLETLRECLPRNLQDNSDYPNLEYVILDYNSRRDNVWGWLSQRFQRELAVGTLVYYRTEEPQYYSMTHSRNLAFRLATGTVVNNVDADNFTGKAFASYLNLLANECPENAVFAKGKQLLHGRIGFFKSDFVERLGGYDEQIEGYGYDDRDLVERAMALGFTFMWYGGCFFDRILTPMRDKGLNMQNRDCRQTEAKNKAVSLANIAAGKLKANLSGPWGVGRVTRNGRDAMTIQG